MRYLHSRLKPATNSGPICPNCYKWFAGKQEIKNILQFEESMCNRILKNNNQTGSCTQNSLSYSRLKNLYT